MSGKWISTRIPNVNTDSNPIPDAKTNPYPKVTRTHGPTTHGPTRIASAVRSSRSSGVGTVGGRNVSIALTIAITISVNMTIAITTTITIAQIQTGYRILSLTLTLTGAHTLSLSRILSVAHTLT